MIYDKNNEPWEPEPEAETTEVKPKKQKASKKQVVSWKRKAVILLIKLTILVTLLLLAVYGIDKFFDKHTFKFQTPLIIQSPILLEKRPEPQAQVTELVPTAHAAEVPAEPVKPEPKPVEVPKHNISEIVRRVYQLESSSGVNDGCRDKGLYNGFGYRQNKREWKCFNSHEEVAGYVADLFTERLQVMSLSKALCYYQSGYKVDNCEYYQKYLRIK